MFTGLSAFPLTPLNEINLDETAFIGLLERLVCAQVDSNGTLGSTGSYAYLNRTERKRIAELSVEHAQGIPVMASISALRTRDVLLLAEDMQQVGVNAVLLAPVSYQKLTDEEVYQHYATVSRALSVPLCIYDNPGTTNFEFSHALYAEIASLANIRSIKIPGVPTELDIATDHINALKSLVSSDVSLGVSGDAHGSNGLMAGCQLWYSGIAGLFPNSMLRITRAIQGKNYPEALTLNQTLEPLWALFNQHGSLRVIAAAAELLGLVNENCLPLPLRSLSKESRQQLFSVLNKLDLN
jgi:4-hydroxy-tetrahydrodipicolinate synthase